MSSNLVFVSWKKLARAVEALAGKAVPLAYTTGMGPESLGATDRRLIFVNANEVKSLEDVLAVVGHELCHVLHPAWDETTIGFDAESRLLAERLGTLYRRYRKETA